MARTLSQERPTIVHAYEDGAEATFRIAGELGIFRSYELPIAYWTTTRRLLMEEAERLPDWEPTLEDSLNLIACLPEVAALIYRCNLRDEKIQLEISKLPLTPYFSHLNKFVLYGEMIDF